jgi:hypothetical protein
MDDAKQRVACPRCGQDWLVEVNLVQLEEHGVICMECDALWISESPEAANFQDYGTYMRSRGRANPDDKAEIEEVGYFRAQT